MRNFKHAVLVLITPAVFLFFPLYATATKDNFAEVDGIKSISETNSAITEYWALIFDSGQGSGNCILYQALDGTVIADGNWSYNYGGAHVYGPYTDASVIISGTSVSITANGTATNFSAPPGYNKSPFILKIIGATLNGLGKGTFSIAFTALGWPSLISGKWEGTRTSGGGITAESKAIPWIFLLLNN